MSTSPKRVAIVGGGIAGLYLAWRLLEASDASDTPESFEIRIYEKDKNSLGGRIRTARLEITARGEKVDLNAELGAMRFPDRHLMISNLSRELVQPTPAEKPLGREDEKGNSHQLGRKGPFDLSSLFYTRGRLLTAHDFQTEQIPYNLLPEERGKTPDQLLEYAILRAFEQIKINEMAPGQSKVEDNSGGRPDPFVEALKEKIKKHQVIDPKDWMKLSEHGEFLGVKLRNIGFWNLIKHFLSSEAFLLVHDGFGFASVISNWNAPEAFKWIIADFSPYQQFLNIPGGFSQVVKKLEKSIGKRSIRSGYNLQSISLDESTKKFELTFEDNTQPEEDSVKREEADFVILALPPKALRGVDLPNLLKGEKRRWRKLINTSRPHRLEKIFLVYEEPWWKHTNIPRAESGRVFTDLPMRQIYYYGPEWLRENKYSTSEKDLSLLMVYNDSHYEGFWRTFSVCESVFVDDELSDEKGDEWYHHALGALPDLQAGKVSLELTDRFEERRLVRGRMEDKVRKQLSEMHNYEVPKSLGGVHRDWAEEGGWHTWEPFVNVQWVKRILIQPLTRDGKAVCKREEVDRADLYVCGEAFAWEQGWIEGALMSAEAVFAELCPKLKKQYGKPSWVRVDEAEWEKYMLPEHIACPHYADLLKGKGGRLGGISKAASDNGITLPKPPRSMASYVPSAQSGNLLAVSGIIPVTEGGTLNITGRVGDKVTLSDAQKCAEQCALNLLAQLADIEATEDVVIDRILRLTGYVSSTPDFTQQHIVINSASDFLVRILKDKGMHTREAVGVAVLPLDAPVEISAWVAVRPRTEAERAG